MEGKLLMTRTVISKIALFLAIVMLLVSFASCGGAVTEETTVAAGKENNEVTSEKVGEASEEITTEEEYKPDIEVKNYNSEFYLSIMGDVNPVEYYWVAESSNDAMTEALYLRQENVRKHIVANIFTN